MSNVRILNRRKLAFKGSYEFLKRWQWDIMATLTFKPENRRISSHYARIKFERWVANHMREKNIQIGGIYILCYQCGHPHIHALLLGRGRGANDKRTLCDFSLGSFNKYWYSIAKIEIPANQKAVAKYLASHHFSYKCDRATLDIINGDFLFRHRCRHPDR